MRLSWIAGLALAALTLPAHSAFAQDKPTDAQIFGILSAANTGEIDEGKAAQEKSTNKEVKKLADMMVKEHTSMNSEGTKLSQKLKITPEDSSASSDLKQTSQSNMTKMQGLSGAAFDKAYVDAQVADHQKVLTTIDNTLIPAAQDKQLRSMLHKARGKIAAHLQHAKHVQEKLQKSSSQARNN